MLSASTYAPSDFRSADPAALTEIQIGASYVAATQRSILCVVVGSELDVAGWAVASCLKQSAEITGRPGTPLSTALSARTTRSFVKS